MSTSRSRSVKKKPSSDQLTTFEEYRKRQFTLAEEMHLIYNVDKDLAYKLIQYCQMLPTPGTGDVISENMFMAQLGYRFGITSRFHLQCVYEAVLRKADGVIRVRDLVRLLCIFYSDNLDIKINFVFSVYDITSDGVLTHYELYQLLRTAVMQVDQDDESLGDEPVDDLIDLVRNLLDRNKDGKISLEEYRNYVKDNILFIQLFGQVLPSDVDLNQFRSLLFSKDDAEIKIYFRNERRRCFKVPPIPSESEKNSIFRQLYSVDLDLVDFL